MAVTCDLTRNKKQIQLYNEVMLEIAAHEKTLKGEEIPDEWNIGNRFFFFGGAVRGGKTFGCLAILVLLCRIYPKSRWHVIRRSMKDLKLTAIPSIENTNVPCDKELINNNPKNIFVPRSVSRSSLID